MKAESRAPPSSWAPGGGQPDLSSLGPSTGSSQRKVVPKPAPQHPQKDGQSSLSPPYIQRWPWTTHTQRPLASQALRAALCGAVCPAPPCTRLVPPGIHSLTARRAVLVEQPARAPRPQPQGSFCSHGPGAEASVGWGGCLVRTFPTAPPQLRPTPWRPHSLAPPQLGRRCGKCPCHNPPRSHLLCTLPPPKQPAPSLGIATGASTCSHPAPSCLCGLHGPPTPGTPHLGRALICREGLGRRPQVK